MKSTNRILHPRRLVAALALALGAAPVWAAQGARHATSPGSTPRVLVGAFPAPPVGAGSGRLAVLEPGGARVLHFGVPGSASGNSFYVAADPRTHRLFVPTLAGTTFVFDTRTWTPASSFPTIPGGRVARVSDRLGLLFVLSGRQLGAYDLATGALRYTVEFGGNALAFGPGDAHVYVGGNMDREIADVDAGTGRVLRLMPVGHSGDLAWAGGWLFSADMKTGVMTAIDPASNRIVEMPTPEVDPAFDYRRIPAASAGFMQLAVSPDGRTVYAGGFSGHVLRFSARHPAYLGEVRIGAAMPAKISGMTLAARGRQGVVTVENRDETLRFDLQTGKVLQDARGIAANRWVRLAS